MTGNPTLRVNITISSTPVSARTFYKNDLLNGTFGRMVFSYKPRTARNGRIPRQGRYDEAYLTELDVYLDRIAACKGTFIIKSLNLFIEKLAKDMAAVADLADDDMLWDLSKRSLVSAWKAGCILWALNEMEWTRGMADLVEWLAFYDLWSKMQIFSDMLEKSNDCMNDATKSGPRNMLDHMPDPFTELQLQALRQSMGKNAEGAKQQIYVWSNRKFITYDPITGLYTKSDTYLKKSKNKK